MLISGYVELTIVLKGRNFAGLTRFLGRKSVTDVIATRTGVSHKPMNIIARLGVKVSSDASNLIRCWIILSFYKADLLIRHIALQCCYAQLCCYACDGVFLDLRAKL